MNLKELTPNKTKRLNKVMESRFGFAIDYDSLSYAKAQRLDYAITENLNKIRRSYGIHTAEKNPKYMEMLMVQEGLKEWLGARDVILEGEVEQAEAVLAAKDMVDTIQDMITDASKMLNEQLPPLIDSIRSQVGTQEAESFKGSAQQALQSLLDNLGQARDSMDGAARQVAGEEAVAPNMDMGGGDIGSDVGLDGGDIGSDLDQDTGFSGAEAAAGGEEPLGRERR